MKIKQTRQDVVSNKSTQPNTNQILTNNPPTLLRTKRTTIPKNNEKKTDKQIDESVSPITVGSHYGWFPFFETSDSQAFGIRWVRHADPGVPTYELGDH